MLKLSVSFRKSVVAFALLMLTISLMSASCQEDGCPNKITKEYPKEQANEKEV